MVRSAERGLGIHSRMDAVRGLGAGAIEAFPATFRWGLATAAYQIEGGASDGGRGESIWDVFSRTPGLTLHGDTGDVACDHYLRYEDDVDLLAAMGVKHYRLSLSWSRLQPAGRGPLNPEAVAFYRRLLGALRDRGIEPLVTLYHWDLPQTLEAEGGWPVRATAVNFADYAARAVAELDDLVTDWVTLNEPWCSSILGYGTGAHAPGRRDYHAAVAAAHHLNLAHGLAVERIRSQSTHARVGIANIVTDVVAASDSPLDLAAAARLDAASNRLFLDPVYIGEYSELVHEVFDPFGLDAVTAPSDLAVIAAPVDFVGVNHYQRVIAQHDDDAGPARASERPAEPASTSFGWSVIPDSLRVVLRRVAAQSGDLPIYITENGASFSDYVDPNGEVVDSERVEYLRGYLTAAAAAITEGVPVQGYYAWSFLDNFEWAEGYSKRFGLVYVDYRTQERIPKLSAHWYRQTIGDHARSRTTPATIVHNAPKR